MATLLVSSVLKDKILISRESAHLLEAEFIAIKMREGSHVEAIDTCGLTIDFAGVDGVSPSFVDELLCIFDSLTREKNDGRQRCLTVTNPPMRLSLKFEAVARGHGMTVRAMPNGSWLLTDARTSSR